MNREERINEYKKDELWANTAQNFPYLIKGLTEKYIYCPHCGEEQQDDDGQYPVTYWGDQQDEGIITFTCQSCEKDFTVREKVQRSYETFKPGEDE